MDYKWEIEKLEREIHRYYLRCSFGQGASGKMHPGQLPIIGIISEKKGNTQSAIAKALGVSVASVAVSVARLERAGLVKKKADSDDRRNTHIELTAEGERCAAESRAYIDDILKVKYKDYSDEELATLFGLMRRSRDNLKEKYENREEL